MRQGEREYVLELARLRYGNVSEVVPFANQIKNLSVGQTVPAPFDSDPRGTVFFGKITVSSNLDAGVITCYDYNAEGGSGLSVGFQFEYTAGPVQVDGVFFSWVAVSGGTADHGVHVEGWKIKLGA